MTRAGCHHACTDDASAITLRTWGTHAAVRAYDTTAAAIVRVWPHHDVARDVVVVAEVGAMRAEMVSTVGADAGPGVAAEADKTKVGVSQRCISEVHQQNYIVTYHGFLQNFCVKYIYLLSIFNIFL